MAQDGSPYPSFKERRDRMEIVQMSEAAKRIYWPFQEGITPSALSVIESPRNIGSLEPFFRPNDGNKGIWHEIASLPATEPKVSSLEATFRGLDQWECNWVKWHECHDGAKYTTYGELSDEDRPYAKEQKEDLGWEEDSDTKFLISCCGEDRPLHMRGLKIEVKPSAGNDFVTVLDYINSKPWHYYFAALIELF